jgi:aspartate/tyrosine/aromatic aminotransferase
VILVKKISCWSPVCLWKGLPYKGPSVAQAEDVILHKSNKKYISMIGFRTSLNDAQTLLWTDAVPAEIGNRIATVGTGAIHLCRVILPVPQVTPSDSAWRAPASF